MYFIFILLGVQDLVDAQGGMKNGIKSLFQQGDTLTKNAREDIDQNIQKFLTAVKVPDIRSVKQRQRKYINLNSFSTSK